MQQISNDLNMKLPKNFHVNNYQKHLTLNLTEQL